MCVGIVVSEWSARIRKSSVPQREVSDETNPLCAVSMLDQNASFPLTVRLHRMSVYLRRTGL